MEVSARITTLVSKARALVLDFLTPQEVKRMRREFGAITGFMKTASPSQRVSMSARAQQILQADEKK